MEMERYPIVMQYDIILGEALGVFISLQEIKDILEDEGITYDDGRFTEFLNMLLEPEYHGYDWKHDICLGVSNHIANAAIAWMLNKPGTGVNVQERWGVLKNEER